MVHRRRPIIVHDLDHARAALAAAAAVGSTVTLRSAPGAAASLGPAVFREIVAEARRAFPDVVVTAVLDCGEDPGLALAAFRHGLRRVKVCVEGEVKARLAEIAARSGAAIENEDEPALDLLEAEDPAAAARAWLEGDAHG